MKMKDNKIPLKKESVVKKVSSEVRVNVYSNTQTFAKSSHNASLRLNVKNYKFNSAEVNEIG